MKIAFRQFQKLSRKIVVWRSDAKCFFRISQTVDKLKGDAMNLRRIFCVLELIILVFWVLCIKYVTKYIKFPFIWHTVSLCSLISVGVTGKSVKNQFFDFSQFCQKNFFKMECQNFCQYCHFSCKNGTQKQKNKRVHHWIL